MPIAPVPDRAASTQRTLRLAVVAVATAVLTTILVLAVSNATSSASAPEIPTLGGDLPSPTHPGYNVLFLGNSLTAANGMTGMLERLAAGVPGGPRVNAYQDVPGGQTLAYHAESQTDLDLIAEHPFNDIVLQEDSHAANDPRFVQSSTVPSAEALAQRAAATGARTLIFETWGYREGYPPGFASDTYLRAQERAQALAQTVAQTLNTPPVAVGFAWTRALTLQPQIGLWQPDGVHPSLLGSYLTAAVFYAELFGDPTPSGYTAGLDDGQARWLRQVAEDSVSAVGLTPREQQSAHPGVESGQSSLPGIADDPWSGWTGQT